MPPALLPLVRAVDVRTLPSRARRAPGRPVPPLQEPRAPTVPGRRHLVPEPVVEVGTLLDIAPAPCTTEILRRAAPTGIRMDIGYDDRGVDLLGSVPPSRWRRAASTCSSATTCWSTCPTTWRRCVSSPRAGPGGVGLVQVPIRFGMPTDEDLSADEAERVRRFGQHDHVRYYGDDFEQRLLDAGLVFTRVSPRSLGSGSAGAGLSRTRVWVVRSSVHAEGEVAPLVVPPPTG